MINIISRRKIYLSDSDFSDEEESIVPSNAVTQLKPNVPVITGKKHLNDLKSLLDLDSYQAKLVSMVSRVQ